MFDKIGQFSSKYRYPIIAAWVIALVVITLFAPNIADVVVSDQSGYLPKDEPSIIAAQVATEYFPDQASPSQAVLVIKSEQDSMHDEAIQAYLTDLTGWLENDLSPQVVGQVLSPADPNLTGRLISEDGQVSMIFVGLHGSIEDPATTEALSDMQARLDAAPAGLTGYVTGSVAIVDEYKSSALESADRTTMITIILVIVILLIIYRSPVSPIIPLATIGVAFLVSRGLVAWLSNFGLTVSSITEVFLVVILFGAGTDYCLFLVSRFREYMADKLPGPEGARHTVSRVGETISSSAGTVIVGMVAMSFAKMKLFASTGPSLAIGVAVALLAGLTLTPALLAVLGRWAFWPGGARHAREGDFWSKLAHWVTARPWLPLTLAIVVLLPLAIYGQGQQRNFDLLADLPDDMPSKAGFLLLSEAFGAGEMQPLDIIVTEIPRARDPEGLAYIHALTQNLLAVKGVADVRSLTLPAGQGDPELSDALRVDAQLTLMLDMIDNLRDQTGNLATLAGTDVEEAMAGFDTLRTYLDELAAAFPDLSTDANYQASREALDNLEKAIEAGQQRLLVSTQLAEAAGGLAGAIGQENQVAPAAVDALGEMTAQFSTLRTYLTGMAGTYPAIADMDGYDDALAAMNSLETTVTEITNTLLVSTQLDLLAEGISDMATMLKDPAALSELAALPAQAEAMTALDAYLQELVEAYPVLATQPAFQSATAHLLAVQSTTSEMAQGLLVSGQLALIARQIDTMAQALEENPLTLMPQPDEPGADEQMAALSAYLEELGDAYPSLATTEDYQTAVTVVGEMGTSLETIDLTQIAELIAGTKESLALLSPALYGLSDTAAETLPEATFIPENLPGSMTAMMPDLTTLQDELTAAADDFTALAETVRREMPQATFVPQTALPGADSVPDPLPAVEASLADLAAALERLSAAAATELPDATYLPPDELFAGEAEAVVESLLADVDAFQAALSALAGEFAGRENGFFIPLALADEEAAGADLTQLLDTYTTASGDAARLQVILEDDPFAPEAMDTVARLRDEVSHASHGYISGGTATYLDMRQVLDGDTVRVMALVLAGISVVLVLLLRSIVAPVYMIATILLSYGATLGLTRLVFDGIYHEGLTWWVSFLIFVVLVALGMDYNIFLMGRVKEEVAGNGTRAGIERAVQRTGGIITSAGIIMAGTFAAMMASSLQGLVQLAFAVTVGMLLDTFVIRTTLVPAIAVLLDRWNWWPGKEPGK